MKEPTGSLTTKTRHSETTKSLMLQMRLDEVEVLRDRNKELQDEVDRLQERVDFLEKEFPQ